MLKYETIAQDIQNRIEEGDLAPNDKLPTVVDLCDRYGVSKITVKRAFEILTEKGDHRQARLRDPHREGPHRQQARVGHLREEHHGAL